MLGLNFQLKRYICQKTICPFGIASFATLIMWHQKKKRARNDILPCVHICKHSSSQKDILKWCTEKCVRWKKEWFGWVALSRVEEWHWKMEREVVFGRMRTCTMSKHLQWQCNGSAIACTAQWQKQCICSMKTCHPRSNQKGLVFVWVQYSRAGWDSRIYYTALVAAWEASVN